jgi:hypothetical protein
MSKQKNSRSRLDKRSRQKMATEAPEKKQAEVLPIYRMTDLMTFDGIPDDVYGGHAHPTAKRDKFLKAWMVGEDIGDVTVWSVTEYASSQVTDPKEVFWDYSWKKEAEWTK